MAPGILARVSLLCNRGLNWAPWRMSFLGLSPASPAQSWECSCWLLLKKGSSVTSLVPFKAACHPHVSKGTALSPRG